MIPIASLEKLKKSKKQLSKIGKKFYNFFTELSETETKKQKNWWHRNMYTLGESLLMVGIYVFLFYGLKMEWFLRDIIPIGGDVPYHFANYIDLKEILLPDFQISGWSDASFGGFQLFQSYPIFPFILIYILDLFMGSGVAFKAVMMLGAVGLPLAIYWTLMQAKVARPGPIFGAILSLAYLFHDDHFAFGGNLRSVFSGEFSYSLSILFLMIFCGFLYKAFDNKKYIPHAIIMLSLIGFSHPISFAVGIFLPLGFLILPKQEDQEKETSIDTLGFSERSSIALRIMLIGALLFGTWAIGFYVNQKYGGFGEREIFTDTYGWGLTFHYLIPKLLWPFAILFLGTILSYIFSGKKISALQILCLWGFLISMGFFLCKFMGFAVRFLPLIYLFVMLCIAGTFGKIYHETKDDVVRIAVLCLIIASSTFIFYYVNANNLFQRYVGTSGFNFMGAEYREEWNEVQLTSAYLSENFDTQTKDTHITAPARVFSYFKGDLFRVTSRASMYDSLFSHSPFTTSEIWTSRQIENKKISVEQIWNYMVLSNTAIIIAPKDLREYFEKTPYFDAIKTFDTYTLFETNHTRNRYVIPLHNDVNTATDKEKWDTLTNKWYEKYTEKSAFIVYDPDKSYPLGRSSDLQCRAEEFVERGKIHIQTNCIGTPLLIKFAYHQNWKVKGAQKVYYVTPNFMLIIPQQNEVTLFYGKRPYNYLAYASGILGIILLFTHTLLERVLISTYKKIKKKYKKIFHYLSLVAQKLHLSIVGESLVKKSVPFLLIIALLVSIAFVYTNRG